MVTALLPIIFIVALSIPDGLEVKTFGKFHDCGFVETFEIFQNNSFLFSRLVVLSMLASTNR